MKKILFFAVLTAVMLVQACSHDGNHHQTQQGNAIDFRSVVDKSRASLITNTNELTSFFVQAGVTGQNDLAFMSAAVYKEGINWVYSPIKYYPTTGTLDFYGYAPIKDVNMTTAMASTTDVTFGYTVPSDQSVANTSTDLLVASVLANSASPVNMIFNHALSAVTFSASNQNTPSTNLIVRISKIEIIELDNVGTFTFPWDADNTVCWANAGAANVTYKAGIPQSGVVIAPTGNIAPVYVNLLSANDVMMVLPQTPALGTITAGTPNDDGTYVEVTYTITDATGEPISGNPSDVSILALPAGFAFEPSVLYNFRFDFTADMLNPISFTVEVNDWVPQTVVVP